MHSVHLSFKVGQWVQWESAASGASKAKCGFVEELIPAGKRPNDEQRREADAYGQARDHMSYLVRMPSKTGRGKGKLYWPLTSKLTPAQGQFPEIQLAQRKLKSGRCVPERRTDAEITITTKCPSKWAMVDLETGDIWTHDGATFSRATDEISSEVIEVASSAKRRAAA